MRVDLPWLHRDDLPCTYRALSFACDGQAIRNTPLDARSDREAIQQARALAREIAIDLWDGLRFVDHFAARAATAD